MIYWFLSIPLPPPSFTNLPWLKIHQLTTSWVCFLLGWSKGRGNVLKVSAKHIKLTSWTTWIIFQVKHLPTLNMVIVVYTCTYINWHLQISLLIAILHMQLMPLPNKTLHYTGYPTPFPLHILKIPFFLQKSVKALLNWWIGRQFACDQISHLHSTSWPHIKMHKAIHTKNQSPCLQSS